MPPPTPMPPLARTLRSVVWWPPMATLQGRVSRLEGAYEQLDQRLGDIQASLNGLDARIDGLFRMMIAMMAVMATGGIAIAGAIVTLALRI